MFFVLFRSFLFFMCRVFVCVFFLLSQNRKLLTPRNSPPNRNQPPNPTPHHTTPNHRTTEPPNPTTQHSTHPPNPTPQASVPLASSSCQGYHKTPKRDTLPPCLWRQHRADSEQTWTSRWQTYLTTYSVLVKLLRNGVVFNVKGENDSIRCHHRDPTTTVPLFLHKNSLRIRANPIVHHVSPVMEDDMPVRLSAQSPLRLLDRRLDELALPRHGTKLDK